MAHRTRWGDLLVALGVLVSITVAVLSAVWADLSAAIVVASGLIGIVVALQVDLVLRLIQRTRLDGRQLAVLSRIVEAGELTSPLGSLVTQLARVPGSTDARLVPLAHRELEKSLRYLRRLESGHVILDDGDTSLMIDRIVTVTRRIKATTFADVDHEWWTCPAGREYLAANSAAIARGALITRVLVYREWDDKARELAAAQLAAGVTLRRIPRSGLPPDLLRNMVVYDDRFLVEDEVDLDGGVTGCLHALDEATVGRAVDAFDRIWGRSEEVR